AYIRNNIDSQLLSGIHAITGNVYVDGGNNLDLSIVLPDLQSIEGTLYHLADCKSLSIPNLVTVGGRVDIVSLTAMQFDLHALTHAQIVAITGPAVVDLSALATVDEAIAFSSIKLTTIDLPNLRTVGDLLMVGPEIQPMLTSIDAPMLVSVPKI